MKSQPLEQNGQSPLGSTGHGATGSSRSPAQPFSAFGSLSQFRDAQRMATVLAHSSLVPEGYRGEDHVGDCVIVLEIAHRLGVPVLAVMQNLQRVHGRPGWSSPFLISCVNASRRFSPLRYEMTGTRGTDQRGCLAWALDQAGERLESPEVTLKLAKQEGWYYRIGSKWRTMPELMLRYRSATLFARLYAPEFTMGIQTMEEIVDTGEGTDSPPARPVFDGDGPPPETEPAPPSKTAPAVDVPPEAPPKPASARPRHRKIPGPEPTPSEKSPSPQTSGPAPHSASGHYHYLKALTGLIGLSPHSELDVLNFLRQTHRCDASLTGLPEVAGQQPEVIVWTHDHWNSVEQEMAQLQKGRGA
jgi:hypothetical protein